MAARVSRTGGRWSLLYGSADDTTAMRSYEVLLEPLRRGRQIVHIDGRRVTVSFVDRRGRAAHGGGPRGGPSTASGSHDIVAPMPGRVVKVLVAPGDTVAAHQGLVVVEAMKMENELRAARAGTVAAVHVAEGVSVEAGTVLVVVE
jgi:pyruvate carboxylase subunit B